MPAGCSLTDAGRACLPSAPPRRKPKPARPSSLPPFHRSAPLPASHGVGLLQLLRQLLRRLLRLCGGNGEANRRRAGDARRVVDVAALDADLVRRARRTVRRRCGGEARGQVGAQRACAAFLFAGALPRRRWGASARTHAALAGGTCRHARTGHFEHRDAVQPHAAVVRPRAWEPANATSRRSPEWPGR